MSKNYSLDSPVDAIVFDCDGTLSSIEGIEVLAHHNKVADRVCELTERAMSHEGISADLYKERLDLVQPSLSDVTALGQYYYTTCTMDVAAIIDCLQRIGKAVFVMSAGVNPAVKLFAGMLGIPMNQVYAVDLEFTADGQYQSYDAKAYPAQQDGKRDLVCQIQAEYPRVIHVGDGMNDIAVLDRVERFVGYGGAKFRQKIADLSPFYICCESMAPLLPLCLSADELSALNENEMQLFNKGKMLIKNNQVLGC